MVKIFTSFRKVTAKERAYSAGLYEGEGSVVLTGRKRKSGWQVEIAMTDKEPLSKMQEIWGGNIRGPYLRGKAHYKPTYVWRINGYEQVERFYILIESFLSPRRKDQFISILSIVPASFPLSGETCGRDSISGMLRHRRKSEAPCLGCRMAVNRYNFERGNPGQVWEPSEDFTRRYIKPH